MHFAVRAVSSAEYNQWITQAKAAGPTLDQSAYRALARPSSNVAASSFTNVDPKLFDDIVAGRLIPPAFGAEAGGQDRPSMTKEP